MSDVYDFIVVGSGAGGGPLAARLAEAGFTVCLVEAGDEHVCDYYNVPIMQAYASEDPDMRWDYFVRHHDDEGQQQRDPKDVADRGGVLYPRGSTLGGSTAISAMVTMRPQESDWRGLAGALGDASWAPEAMQDYFERFEVWRGVDAEPWPEQDFESYRAKTGHGSVGWLGTTRADPRVGGRDSQFLDIIAALERTSRSLGLTPPEVALPRDPNDREFLRRRGEGMTFIPVAVRDGRRNGSRERVLDAAAQTGRLRLQLNTFVTRVVFEQKRAVGVEVIEQGNVFRARPHAQTGPVPGQSRRVIRARCEVIVCAGAFATPQLMMLSGIGPASHLREMGIPLLVDSPGVGHHLQDRYEVSVVAQMCRPFSILEGADLDIPARGQTGDYHYQEWMADGFGPYATNGSLAGLMVRSREAGEDPDLFVFALPIDFRGYYPGYAKDAVAATDRLSIVVLKAHTDNDRGTVRLRSADPLDTPHIRFDYFMDDLADMRAVVEGVDVARQVLSELGDQRVAAELSPGPAVQDDQRVTEWVRDNAWGHHACGTMRAGRDDDLTTPLDSTFKVRGVKGLRVVDASVFPKIPGMFIATAVYLVAEKMSDTIIAAHAASREHQT